MTQFPKDGFNPVWSKKPLCFDCVHRGIKFPYEKGGCYDCVEFNNYKPKERELICPSCQVSYAIIPANSRVQAEPCGNHHHRIVAIEKCGPCIELVAKRIIRMKHYCLEQLIMYRNMMRSKLFLEDYIRRYLLQIWLEQYFLVEKRFGEDYHAL